MSVPVSQTGASAGLFRARRCPARRAFNRQSACTGALAEACDANALADRWPATARDSYEPLPDVPDGREAEDIERRAMVFQLVDRLPEMQRRVIEMRFVDERSIREIAHTLERSEGAVKQLQLRALSSLRKGLEGRDG